MNKLAKAGFGLAALGLVAGCENFPEEKSTDMHALEILGNKDNPQKLIGTYHVMEADEGGQLGVIFFQSVTQENGTACASYSTWAGNENSGFRQLQSHLRDVCVLSPGSKN